MLLRKKTSDKYKENNGFSFEIANIYCSPVQSSFLLAVSGVGHGHPLLAALGLHGGDVEHEVRADDAGSRLPGPHHPAVLPEGVTHAAHVQVLLGDFNLNIE